MTCLTVTPDSAQEAIEEQAGLIVTHHPVLFRPVQRLTTDAVEGHILLDLIAGGVAVYSPHTAFDSTSGGINERLCAGIGLVDVAPLTPLPDNPQLGSGRCGRLVAPCSLANLVDRVKSFLSIERVQVVGDLQRQVTRLATACGSGGSFLTAAREQGCDVLITGEASFHTCLEAEATGIALVLAGHYATERFAVELLAEHLQREFGDLVVWACRCESDPLTWH
jgi:dinuclear metal center YbgI/SA1388 family protein